MRDALIRFFDRTLGQCKTEQSYPGGGRIRGCCILGVRYFMFDGKHLDGKPEVVRTVVFVLGNHEFYWRVSTGWY